MNEVNLPDSVKNLSEMYALGCIMLTQVAEEVEKFPLHEQALMMSRAMIHAELYYREYEEWSNKLDLDDYSEDSEAQVSAEDRVRTAEDNYEFWLSTGGQFHSPEEFVEEYIEYLKEKDDYNRSFC